ncbi:MAG: cytochrome c family protein [Anaerolineae bacterium]|nr:cytochrome c family protein [Anaerolineae bacterium]
MARKLSLTLLLVGLLAIAIGVVLSGCQSEPTQVEVTREVITEVTVEVPGPEVEVTRVVEVMLEPDVPVIPFEERWASSPHADASAEAFVHWDEDDPAEVPTSCAKCHSTPGYLDFIGADGSEAGVVDAAAPIGTVVTCEACHNDVTVDMTSVTFPSGVEVTGLEAEARCIQCHQGRASTVSVNQSIADAGLTEEQLDVVSDDLGFTNIHYYAAAATQFGTVTMGGYEYDGKAYDAKYDHVPGYNTCTSCHDSHTLEIKFEECTTCHTDLNSAEDLVDVRMPGSLVDYDGDGDMDEGVYYEIEGMREALYSAMQAYSAEIAGAPIIYDASSYPYFFEDTDGNGEVGEADGRYANWTPRLAKAAYNYQVSLKDPGRFAHGGKYIIQLLYDSLEDLNMAISEPIDMAAMSRIDHGHFAGSEEAFRHWDAEGEVPGSCSRCHSAAGLPLFIEEGVSIAQHTSNGLNCTTCHNDLTEFTIYESTEVPFPSGAVLSFGENDVEANLCINCHQGRESTISVDQRLAGKDDDVVDESIRFTNIHYFAAGATLFGDEAKGAYQWAGQEYVGRNEHVGAFNSCTECHDTHALEVIVEECSDCHEEVETKADLQSIRFSDDDDAVEIDYDGDGDNAEGIYGEIDTMRTALYAALQEYATNTVGAGILYDANSYPYFFNDLNGNGEADPDEINGGNGYSTWTPNLLRAAYNYQYAAKDPGAYAHNGPYVVQILYDSINGVGGDVSAMTRP